MVVEPKGSGAVLLRVIVGLALLGCARMGSAQGSWSVISLPQQPGDVVSPTALAVDAAGDLYVADGSNGGRIQKRDAQGNWSVIATYGSAPGRVQGPSALAVDTAGNLYVADYGNGWRIQKRDPQGNWSVIANFPRSLCGRHGGQPLRRGGRHREARCPRELVRDRHLRHRHRPGD